MADKPDVTYADTGFLADGKKRYPIDSAEHVDASQRAIGQAGNASKYSPERLAVIKSRIGAAGRRFGVTFGATAKRGEELIDVSRSEDLLAWPTLITRSFAVDDAAVRSGRVTCEGCGLDATGRMVDAYAAVFGEETEVHDDHGHYVEDIDRAAFNRRLDHISRSAAGVRGVNVYYNHAMTVHGSPSELASVPVGHPSIIRADGRGLLTATHYSRDPFADRILNGIIDGNIAGQSFTGRIVRSDPDRIPRVHRGGSLPKVRRLELGLAEYGPTPQPYYAGALTVAVRAQLPDQHPDGPAGTAPPPQQPGPGTEDPHVVRALRSAEENQRKIRRFLVSRGLHNGSNSG